MKKKLSHPTFKATRLGRINTEDQVRQALSSATLEGLKPSQQSIDLVKAIAAGKITREVALTSLRGYHGRYA